MSNTHNQGRCRGQVSQWDADAEKATAEANKEAHVAVNLQKQVPSENLNLDRTHYLQV